MNGHILLHTDIAVDYWKIKGTRQHYCHFLTHVHGDHIVGLTSSWSQPIYCSEITAMLLEDRHGISKHLLKVIPLHEKIILTSNCGPFTVMAFDANHCPGAIMLYFQGSFGTVFYCGDFRSSANMIADCTPVAKNADFLYLDNTFCDKRCSFPPRCECFEQIVDIIQRNPKHNIVIAIHNLGKEILLGELGAHLNETIVVPPKCYQLCCQLFDTNVFTTPFNSHKSRIWAVPVDLSRQAIHGLKATDDNVIVIIPTAKFTGMTRQPFSSLPYVYIVPYSDHSSYPELLEFVAALQPKSIKPIVDKPGSIMGNSLSHRADMSCFDALLSGSLCHDQTPIVEEEGSSLLINQSVNSNEGLNLTDCLSLSSKRVLKSVSPGNGDNSALNTSGVSDNPAREKLESFLKPMFVGKTKKGLKKFKISQKRKRPKIKPKGVLYSEEDPTSSDESLSVDREIVPQSQSLCLKVKGQQKPATRNCRSPKPESNMETAIIIIDSDNDDDDDDSRACGNKTDETVLQKEEFPKAAKRNCLRLEKERNIIVIDDNDSKDMSGAYDITNLDENLTVIESCDKTDDPNLKGIITSRTPEIKTEVLQNSICPKASEPGVCPTERESISSSSVTEFHYVNEQINDCQMTHNPQVNNHGVSYDMHVGLVSNDQDIIISQINTGVFGFDASGSVPESSHEAFHTLLEENDTHQTRTINADEDSKSHGHVLPGTDIAINSWKGRDINDASVYFCTNAQVENLIGLSSSWSKTIYCSETTATLLVQCHRISINLLKILPLGEKIAVTSKSGPFTVVAFDANHCPGAVMLYFHGNFGSVFYCGDFCSSTDVIADCNVVARGVDTLYLDNTFCDSKFSFPTRSECLSQIVDIIREHPKRDIVIGVNELGSATMLFELGVKLKENIVVSQTFYKICNMLFNSDVFINPYSTGHSRIWVMPVNLKSLQEVRSFIRTDHKAIYILPSAALHTDLDRQWCSYLDNLYVVPYSIHSSYAELHEFVSAIRPKCIKPMKTFVDEPYARQRADMSCFDSLLSSPATTFDQYPNYNVGSQISGIKILSTSHQGSACANSFSAEASAVSDVYTFASSKSPPSKLKSFHKRLDKVKGKNILPQAILRHIKQRKQGVVRNVPSKKAKSTKIVVVTGGEKIEKSSPRKKLAMAVTSSIAIDRKVDRQHKQKSKEDPAKASRTNFSVVEVKSSDHESSGVLGLHSRVGAQKLHTLSPQNVTNGPLTLLTHDGLDKGSAQKAQCESIKNSLHSVASTSSAVNIAISDSQQDLRSSRQHFCGSCESLRSDSTVQSNSMRPKRYGGQLLSQERKTFSKALQAFLSKSCKRKSP